jgi:hypothetical protein
MTTRGCLYSTIMWVVLAILAVINGSIREFGLKKYMGDEMAHNISVVTGIGIIFIATLIFFRMFRSLFKLKDAILIGFSWLVLTVAFEFIFGRFVRGLSMEAILKQYDLFGGELWILVLIAIALAPWAALRLVK